MTPYLTPRIFLGNLRTFPATFEYFRETIRNVRAIFGLLLYIINYLHCILSFNIDKQSARSVDQWSARRKDANKVDDDDDDDDDAVYFFLTSM